MEKLCTGGKTLRPIAQVVSILSRKPSLAACIQTVHLSPWETYLGFNSAEVEKALDLWREDLRINGEDEQQEYSQDGSVRLKTFDFSPLHEQAKRVTRSEDEAKFWMDEIKIGNADAWIALLLTLLPNLRQLDVAFPYGSLWLHYVMRWARTGQFGSIMAFPSLSEVYVDWDRENTSICHKHLVPFFLLPSMRRFYAYNLRGGSGYGFDEISNSTETAGTSSITHIEIDGCDGQWDLLKVISFCKNLQSFKYNHRGCQGFDPHAIYRALLPFSETIETVWLDIQERFPRHGDNHLCDDPLPSFRNFTALKTLHLRMNSLSIFAPRSGEDHSDISFAQTLPPSIETLQVAETGNPSDLQILAQKLQHHVDHDLDSTPTLAQIDFRPSLNSPETSEFLENMARVCAKANIKFHVCGISGGRTTWGAAGFTPRLYVKKGSEQDEFIF
ncbi:hypothetical protein EYZ11_008221 [Aspergillus tanneri]|uniref:Leucine-rich repeat domain-containing protein n=1 Tax=Aspergillus tanneri TaxID=1220188 RepID=A0A4S3JGI5_9EURO|nr:hypothetical protein EYZ11_008221 [Aspergillus tanneri]